MEVRPSKLVKIIWFIDDFLYSEISHVLPIKSAIGPEQNSQQINN